MGKPNKGNTGNLVFPFFMPITNGLAVYPINTTLSSSIFAGNSFNPS